MHQLRSVASGLLLACLAFAVQAVPNVPAIGATNGVIASVTSKDAYLIFTVNPDGTSAHLRTHGSAPAWSPDGSSLAYIDPTEHITIHTDEGVVHTGVQADGSDIFTAARIDWSPDGTKLVFARDIEVWVMNATPPYDPVRLTKGRCGNYEPTWSPDSAKIAYREGCSAAITVMNADGTGKTPVPNPLGLQEERPDWSPDGTQFVFLSGLGGVSGVWLMNVDGTDQHMLAETVEFCCGSPDWSPDGMQIAFVGSSARIDIINADGTGLTEVPTPSVAFEPRWGTWQPGP